jgi:hypothetical protein
MDEIKRKLTVKVPWWTYPLRWWNRWKIDRQEKQQAIAHRKEEEERIKEPVYFGVVAGKTRYVDRPEGSNVFITHYWYLYETPEGERSYIAQLAERYSYLSNSKEIERKQKDHPWFGQVILPWINHQIDIDQAALLKDKVQYWNRLNAEKE